MAQAVLRKPHQSELCADTSKSALHGCDTLALVHDESELRWGPIRGKGGRSPSLIFYVPDRQPAREAPGERLARSALLRRYPTDRSEINQATVPINLSCRIEIDDGLWPSPCAQTHYRETEEMGRFERVQHRSHLLDGECRRSRPTSWDFEFG